MSGRRDEGEDGSNIDRSRWKSWPRTESNGGNLLMANAFQRAKTAEEFVHLSRNLHRGWMILLKTYLNFNESKR